MISQSRDGCYEALPLKSVYQRTPTISIASRDADSNRERNGTTSRRLILRISLGGNQETLHFLMKSGDLFDRG